MLALGTVYTSTHQNYICTYFVQYMHAVRLYQVNQAVKHSEGGVIMDSYAHRHPNGSFDIQWHHYINQTQSLSV